jgi:hypothetical protein
LRSTGVQAHHGGRHQQENQNDSLRHSTYACPKQPDASYCSSFASFTGNLPIAWQRIRTQLRPIMKREPHGLPRELEFLVRIRTRSVRRTQVHACVCRLLAL